MIHEAEIRQQLAAVVSKRLSMVAFERWLAEHARHMHIDSSSDAVDLVSLIQALLSERDDDIHSDNDLRAEFSSLLNNIVVSEPVNLPAYRPIGRFVASAVSQLVPVPQRVVA